MVDFDRLLYGGESLLTLSAFSELSVEVGDVRDQAALRRATRGVESVVHLAAVVGEAGCAVDTEFSWSVNHDAVAGVLRAAREARIPRFVFVRTCSNYRVAEPNTEVDEEAGLNPLSDYAKAKVGPERAVLAANGLPAATVLRLATICGVGARMRFDLLVNEMARDAALGREIEIYAPAAWRPLLHIDDAAEAVRRVLEADAAVVGRQVFNVVGEKFGPKYYVDRPVTAPQWGIQFNVTLLLPEQVDRTRRSKGAENESRSWSPEPSIARPVADHGLGRHHAPVRRARARRRHH